MTLACLLVVAGTPRRYGMAAAHIPVFLSQKPSIENGPFPIYGIEICVVTVARVGRRRVSSVQRERAVAEGRVALHQDDGACVMDTSSAFSAWFA